MKIKVKLNFGKKFLFGFISLFLVFIFVGSSAASFIEGRMFHRELYVNTIDPVGLPNDHPGDLAGPLAWTAGNVVFYSEVVFSDGLTVSSTVGADQYYENCNLSGIEANGGTICSCEDGYFVTSIKMDGASVMLNCKEL